MECIGDEMKSYSNNDVTAGERASAVGASK